jgi:ribosomal protein L11 methylase PrmA
MPNNRLRITALIVLLLSVISEIATNAQDATKQMSESHVVYVGTPYDVISIMLEMARIGKDDLIYDLGSGDGRMVILAIQKYNCRGIGYEIDPVMVQASKANILRNRVEDRVQIVQADIFTVDLSEATVIMLYMLPETNKKLLPQLDRMKPGSRIICHNYDLPGIVEDQTLTYLSNEDSTTHIMTLYTTPLKRRAVVNKRPILSLPSNP